MDNVVTLYLHPYHHKRHDLRWIYSWLSFYEEHLAIFPDDAQLRVQVTVLSRLAEEHPPYYSEPATVIPLRR